MSPPARPQAAANSRPSRLSQRILAATGTPSDPGQPTARHAGAGPPRPGPSDVATEDMSQDLLGTDCRKEGHQRALASAPVALVAHPQAPAGNPLTTQAQDGAEASAPPTGSHPPEGPTLDWCAVCRFWRPRPCDQCPPQRAPKEEEEAAEPAPEGERELGPRETSPALNTPTPHAADDPPPPPIDVDASQGTATQLAGLLGDEAGALSPLKPLPPAVESDDDPAPPAAGHADSPPGEMGPHGSRLAALIADTALEEANPCRALDVAVFLDSERLSAVGRRMRAAGQDTTPVPGPHSPEGDGLPPLLAQYAKRTRELLQLVGYTLGVPSLSSWEGDAIPAPHAPGLGITVYYVIEGRVQLRLPTPEGGSRPGWWLQAMAYAYAWSAPPPPRAVPPDTRALVLICQCPVHVPRGTPATAPPPRSKPASSVGTGTPRSTRRAWTSGITGPPSPHPEATPWPSLRPWWPGPATTGLVGDSSSSPRPWGLSSSATPTGRGGAPRGSATPRPSSRPSQSASRSWGRRPRPYETGCSPGSRANGQRGLPP